MSVRFHSGNEHSVLTDKFQCMKHFFAGLLLVFSFSVSALTAPIDTLEFGDFGKVIVYNHTQQPSSLVLFVSGDGGWNKGVVAMGNHLTDHNAMVAGINIQHYLKRLRIRKSACDYPASDFENLSMFLQKKYQFREYLKPILVGYSSGATLIYGIIAQAPFNTFKGAISLGFCPDIETVRPLCAGSGLKYHVLKEGQSYYLEAKPDLSCPFVVLNGVVDQVCGYNATADFLKKINKAELITLPKVGHGFAVERNWLPQFLSSFDKIVASEDQVKEIAPLHEASYVSPALDVKLPLIATPAPANDNAPMVFMISGDGGWTDFDQSVANSLAKKGFPTLGLDAQKYFWSRKTPEQCIHDFSIAIEEYLGKWQKKSFILIGYSFGADVVPFLADRFEENLSKAVSGVVMMSPDKTGDFEIHVTDMLSLGSSKDKYDVIAETKKLQNITVVALFGNEEPAEDISSFRATGAKIEVIPGSHHYNNDVNAVVEAIAPHFLKPEK